MFSKYINSKIFFIALCVGLFYCYVMQPKPRVVLKCPNPDNENKVTYKDKSGSCFKYKSNKVPCPSEDKITSCFNHNHD